jgi:adenine-specific DNA-methyltransferase
MNKLDLETPDFIAANAARLAELFPNCVSETRNPQTGEIKRAIDFDLLRQELAYDIVEGPQERYRLDWPGKREALALANAPIRKTLRPCKAESVDFETTRNLYLEGDNLDALKLLQETYLGKVKMFYIDPPYNTGNDFIYDDDFSMSRSDYQESSGEVDDEGRALFDEEKWKQNNSSNGRFHSEWLSMIYPRLKLARNLLSDDGVIFASIDFRESAGLRRMCDEVFGEVNFIAEIAWEKMYTTKNDSSLVSCCHESVIIFAKNLSRSCIGNLPRSAEMDARYSNPDNDPRGNWKAIPMYADGERKNGRFKIISPTGKSHEPEPNSHWRYAERDVLKLISDNRIWFGQTGNSQPNLKRFLSELGDGVKAKTLWTHKEVGSNDTATRELKELFDGQSPFSFPKPTTLIRRMLQIGASPPDSIVLDFFSGSATTAHGVMQLNSEDGGARRHIMVQLPEPCDEKSVAFKAGYKTITEIGKERIRRAGQKIRKELEDKLANELKGSEEHTPLKSRLDSLDTGFRVLKIDSSNMADVYYQPDELTQDTLSLHVDNLKPGRSPEDLLFQVLLDWGVDFALPITEEKILKHRVFFVAENALAACFDTGLDEAFVKELAKRQPLRAVFRDSGYANDAVKINFEQIFKALSPHTELKTL